MRFTFTVTKGRSVKLQSSTCCKHSIPCTIVKVFVFHFRICLGRSNKTHTLTLLNAGVNITYSQRALESRSAFSIRYVVYEDLCMTKTTATSFPLIIKSTDGAALTENCPLRLNVSAVDSLVIKAIQPQQPHNQTFCDLSDAIKLKKVGDADSGLICKGLDCLETSIDVTNNTQIIRILYNPSVGCAFTWKLTGKESKTPSTN